MKKIFLTLITLAVVTVSFSQVKVRPGIKTGLNYSKITNLNNASRKVGFNGAIFVSIRLGGFYELQPEFSYSNQGWSNTNYAYIDPFGDIVYATNNDNVNIDYIGMSIANKFFVVPGMGFHFIVGPGLEFRVSDNLYYNDVTPVDLTFFGGIGYEFPFGLGFEARYKQGIVDVRNGYYDYYYDDYNYDYDDNYYGNSKLNSVFQFNVYYKFGW